MQKGTIVNVTQKGFGFIAIEGQEKEVFFHANELQNVQFNELNKGDEVTFEVAEGQKGPNAVNINKV